MKISSFDSLHSVSGTKRRKAIGSASFSDFLADASAEVGGADGASEIISAAPVGNLVMLQEISDEDRRRSGRVAQGHSMLDTLEQLRSQLMMGGIPMHMLETMQSHVLEQKLGTSDPALTQLLDEIELRVAVELAKLEMSHAAQSEI